MNDAGDLREDLKLPEGDLGSQLRSEFDVGKELLVSLHCYLLLFIYVTYYIKHQHCLLTIEMFE